MLLVQEPDIENYCAAWTLSNNSTALLYEAALGNTSTRGNGKKMLLTSWYIDQIQPTVELSTFLFIPVAFLFSGTCIELLDCPGF